jgi:hypothetical protein
MGSMVRHEKQMKTIADDFTTPFEQLREALGEYGYGCGALVARAKRERKREPP